MKFWVKAFVAGVVAVFGGAIVTSMGLGEKPVFPGGLYTGPLLVLAGIVLLSLAGRGFRKDPPR